MDHPWIWFWRSKKEGKRNSNNVENEKKDDSEYKICHLGIVIDLFDS